MLINEEFVICFPFVLVIGFNILFILCKLILQFSLQTRPNIPIRVEYLSYKLINRAYENKIELSFVV